MAQSTPTYASGFHLVTVAMTGHAKESGFNYRNTQQFESRCLNAVNESRSEKMGLYRNDQWVACLTEWWWDTALQLDTREYPRRQNLPRRTHRSTINTKQSATI